MENKDIDEIFDGMFSVIPTFRKKIYKIGNDLLANKEISMAHVKLILMLKNEGACKMTDLGKLLQVSKPNITALVDKLVELDMVKRTFDENDRRVIHIELTDKGYDFLEKHFEAMKAALSRNMQKFSTEDLTLLKEAINNMRTLINKMNEEE